MTIRTKQDAKEFLESMTIEPEYGQCKGFSEFTFHSWSGTFGDNCSITLQRNGKNIWRYQGYGQNWRDMAWKEMDLEEAVKFIWEERKNINKSLKEYEKKY